MRAWLPVAFLALTAVILLWDVVLAGRIAQLRKASRPFAALTGLAGLLILPAVIIAVATSTVVTGRAIRNVDWVWPAVLVLFAVQAVYALVRRIVNPTWGVPIAIYDITIAVAGVARWLSAHGQAVPEPFLVLMGAQHAALAVIAGATQLTTAVFLHVPMVSPAFPALRKATGGFRAAMAAVATMWLALFALQLPASDRAFRSYPDTRTERLTERPSGDFAVGLKVLPTIGDAPSSAAVRADLALADTLGVDVLAVTVTPDAGRATLDSVARILQSARRDSTLVVVSLGYRSSMLPAVGPGSLDVPQRLRMVQEVVRRLRPDVLIPAEDPYDLGARVVGRVPLEQWQAYIIEAARIVKRDRPRTRVGIAISAFDHRDSLLYAWAASRESPVEIVGYSFFPGRLGNVQAGAERRAADRWARVTPPTKPHWVLAAGAYPLVHGERAQASAIWSTLAWATARAHVKGLIVYEAGDYGQARGLRAPGGRVRPAGFAVLRAVRGLRETAVRPVAP